MTPLFVRFEGGEVHVETGGFSDEVDVVGDVPIEEEEVLGGVQVFGGEEEERAGLVKGFDVLGGGEM